MNILRHWLSSTLEWHIQKVMHVMYHQNVPIHHNAMSHFGLKYLNDDLNFRMVTGSNFFGWGLLSDSLIKECVLLTVSFQHLQFSKMPQMPLCCGDSYSLSPTTFGHGSLPVSPQQSKHKLVSSAASVSTQNILTSSGLLLFGEANINNRLVCIYIVCIAFFKAQVRAQSQAVSHVFRRYFIFHSADTVTIERFKATITWSFKSFSYFSLQLHPQQQLNGESIHAYI